MIPTEASIYRTWGSLVDQGLSFYLMILAYFQGSAFAMGLYEAAQRFLRNGGACVPGHPVPRREVSSLEMEATCLCRHFSKIDVQRQFLWPVSPYLDHHFFQGMRRIVI
jgi:hypothetical protein